MSNGSMGNAGRVTGRRARRLLVLGFILLFMLSAGVHVAGGAERAAPSISASEPKLISIEEFLRSAPAWGEEHPVKVRGVVTHSISDRTFFIQEAGSGLYVFHKPAVPFLVGELVELIALPSLGGFAPTLHHCSTVRTLGVGLLPKPVSVSVKEACAGRHHMSLVRVQGVLSNERLRGGSTLVLRSPTGPETFTADLEAFPDPGQFDHLQPGSVLELTGVSSVRRNAAKLPVTFNLFVRSPRDVTLIKEPSWWTPQRMWLGLGLTASALLLVLVWVMTLRAQVRRQTADIRRMNERLERRVAERTTELTEANQELEAFSYSVSHDLRAPLRHITGFAALLREGPAVRGAVESLRQIDLIESAALRMGRLIDNLLAFSRLSRRPLSLTRVDTSNLVADVQRELQPDTAGRAIEWRIGPLPEVEADAATLRLVWLNLLGNAIKYTRGRNPAIIEVSASCEKDEWVFSVKDNGAGFDMAYAGKLFGAFQRLHRDEEFEGNGIGLANVRRIVHRHSGRTWAEGKPDQGATFRFSLPRRPSRSGAPGESH